MLEAILAERWHMATTDVAEFEGESAPSETTHEHMDAIITAVRSLGARMVHGIESPDEEKALDKLEASCLAAVEAAVLEFARGVELARAAR